MLGKLALEEAGALTVETPAEGAPTATTGKKTKRKSAARRAAEAEKQLEERLAAFGEAFLESIDTPPPRRRQMGLQQSGADRESGAAATTPAERRRKKARAGAPQAPGPGQGLGRTNRSDTCPGTPDPKRAIVASSGKDETCPVERRPSSARPTLRVGERRLFMSGDVAKIYSKSTDVLTGRKGRTGGDLEEEPEDLKKTLQKVVDLVSVEQDKRVRRSYEEAKVRALGGKLPKQEKTPYNLLQKQRKRFREKRKTILEDSRKQGIPVAFNQFRPSWEVEALSKSKKRAFKDKKRSRENDILKLGLGAREKRGMAVIPLNRIRRAQHRVA